MNPSAATPANDSPAPVAPLWQMILAFAWLVGFAICFYQFDLPNSSPKINRTQIWQQLPAMLINTIDPPEPAAKDVEARQMWRQAGWHNVPQRLRLYGISLVILIGAWAWGNLLLRVLWIPIDCWTMERTFLSLVCGLSLVSLITLACGLAGRLTPTLFQGLFIGAFVVELIARLFTFSSIDLSRIANGFAALHPRRGWLFWAAVPFLMCYVGGAFLPETDFDVKEYHFGGPKEWYLAGQIFFLPHNVYTSFPFLTEMLTLLGMVLCGDWYWGAIAGKGVLMCFGPLTALGVYVAGRRWFSPQAGAWGAFIHLSTPWIYRISIIAYAEGGLACYLFAALVAVMYFLDRAPPITVPPDADEITDRSGSWAILAGFLAGSGMACKYPGVISVVIPCGIAILWAIWKRPSVQTAAMSPRKRVIGYGIVFSIGVLLAIGPWLMKNLLETGNPVYPLLYNVFGGTDWNAELNLKWKHGHSPDNHRLLDLVEKVMDVSVKSDWLSPLLFAFAPLALYTRHRQRALYLWLVVFYLFGTWWLLTHRIDRFWVPFIPVVSLLAGAGVTWNSHRWWRWIVGICITLAALFNFAFMTSSLCGYNAYLLDLDRAAEHTARITSPEVVLLNSQLPPNSKVLFVGEAELFDARFPYAYNTVFDKSLFEEWCGAAGFAGPSTERPLRSAKDVRDVLKQQGITHILVNWQEILRYRLTYGYTDFVTPARFEKLQAEGVLGPAWPSPGGQPLENMRADEIREIRRWAPQLIQTAGGDRLFKTFDVFPVQPE